MSRTINGQVYQAHSTYFSKAEAERAAHTLRNHGWRIRIIQELRRVVGQSSNPKKLYVLYGRRGR